MSKRIKGQRAVITKEESQELAHIDASIVEKFADQQSKHEVIEVLKELFDKNKIFLISSFRRDEINLMTRIILVSSIRDVQVWADACELLAELRLSENRLSRTEVIEAVKANQERKTLLNRMFGGDNMTRRRW